MCVMSESPSSLGYSTAAVSIISPLRLTLSSPDNLSETESAVAVIRSLYSPISSLGSLLPKKCTMGTLDGIDPGPLAGAAPHPCLASTSIMDAKTAAESVPGRVSIPSSGSRFTTSGWSPMRVA